MPPPGFGRSRMKTHAHDQKESRPRVRSEEIISWMDKAVDSYGAYWSSNNTMTLPELCGDHRQIMSGDWVVKYSSRIDTLNAGCFSDYEMVS
jgi:hypothetical protein